uniref:Zinc finger protein 26 n=1 Tax=Lygus hesperus TaxID=30085 RepID=A0A146MCY3_LYGHE
MTMYKSPTTVCCVSDCSSRITFRNKSGFFGFPKKNSSDSGSQLLRRWIDALKITKKLTRHMKVCQRHFKDEDFTNQDGKKVLKPDAVPSNFLPTVWRNKFHPRDYGKLIKLLEMRGIGRLRLCFEAKLGRNIRKSMKVKSKFNKERKKTQTKPFPVKMNGETAIANGGVKNGGADDVMLVSTTAEGDPTAQATVPAPILAIQPSTDPFTSEIDIKDEPFSDHEETIEEMLAKMNDEPIEPKEKRTGANKDSTNITTDPPTTTNAKSSCQMCEKEPCQCKEKQKENNACNICGKGFETSKLLSSHMATHQQAGGDKAKVDIACEICMIGFGSPQQLEEHNKSLHSKPPPRPYVCILCNESFKAKTILMEHVARHAIINNFQCKVCSGYFPNKDDLDSHFRGHRIMKREYSCRECKMILKTRAACWDHLNLHLRGRSKAVGIPCEVCGRILSTRITLKEHMLIHSGEKPFECQLCGRKIRHRVNFLLHVQGHTLGLPHQCSSCGMSFNKKSELNLHVSNEHPEQKDYDCSICGIKFKTESRFLKHAVTHDAHLEE